MLTRAATGMKQAVREQKAYLLARYEDLRSLENGKEFAAAVDA